MVSEAEFLAGLTGSDSAFRLALECLRACGQPFCLIGSLAVNNDTEPVATLAANCQLQSSINLIFDHVYFTPGLGGGSEKSRNMLAGITDDQFLRYSVQQRKQMLRLALSAGPRPSRGVSASGAINH